MYRKNVASQYIFAQLNSRTDGSPLTSAVSVNVAIDNAAQGAGAGTLTHLGNGQWKYAITQAETNGNQIAVQFTHATGVNVGITLITTAADPTNATTLGIGNLDAAVSSRSTYAGADTSGTTTLLSRLTSGRATNLDNLDAAISTRSTLTAQQVWEYATRTVSSFGTLVADVTAAIWGAGTRTLSAFGFSVTVGTNNDKTGYALSAAYDAAKTAATQASVNAIPTTPLLSGDVRLNNLDAAISSRSTYAGTDTAGTTTLVSRLTATRAGNLDNLDAAVSSRSTLAAGAAMTLTGAYDPAKTAANATEVSAIKAKTDQLTFTGGAVDANATATVDTASIAAAVDVTLSAAHGNGIWGSSAGGTGSQSFVVTVGVNGSPLDGASVWITTDEEGDNIVAGSLITDAFGQVTFTLDPGDYFLWKQHAGFNFTNPESITVI